MTAPYKIRFYERLHPDRDFTCWLGDGPPTPTGGGAGHTAVVLPKRAPLSYWAGRDTQMSMSIPIVVGDVKGAPIYIEHSNLMKMYRPDHPTTEPPSVKISSPGDAVPYQGLAWTIADLQWGDAVGNTRGRRLLQKLTVVLAEYVPDQRLKTSKIAGPAQPTKIAEDLYVVRKGDTLAGIARKFDLTGGWKQLGEMQNPPIRDPNKIKVGQTLIISIEKTFGAGVSK